MTIKGTGTLDVKGSITGGYGQSGTGDGNITIEGGVVEGQSITRGTGGNNGNVSAGTESITGGIVFKNGAGQVYGSSVTLSKSFTISEGKTLTIESDKTLIISDGVILTNNGTITMLKITPTGRELRFRQMLPKQDIALAVGMKIVVLQVLLLQRLVRLILEIRHSMQNGYIFRLLIIPQQNPSLVQYQMEMQLR